MKLGTRSRIAIAAAVLSGGALLAPAAAATAGITPCNPDNCDTPVQYYSDATYTQVVGVFEDGVCGERAVGVRTQFSRRYQYLC